MPQNIEIKAKVHNAPRLLELICELTDSLGIILIQEDTFFNSPHGRLKLRVLDEDVIIRRIFQKYHNIVVFRFSPTARWFFTNETMKRVQNFPSISLPKSPTPLRSKCLTKNVSALFVIIVHWIIIF